MSWRRLLEEWVVCFFFDMRDTAKDNTCIMKKKRNVAVLTRNRERKSEAVSQFSFGGLGIPVLQS